MSLGNLFSSLAPMAVGAMFGPGAGALLAGAATGAGISALRNEDPLLGAFTGGLGGYGGGQLGAGFRDVAAKKAVGNLTAPATLYDKGAVMGGFNPSTTMGPLGATQGAVGTTTGSSFAQGSRGLGGLTEGIKAAATSPTEFFKSMGGGDALKGGIKSAAAAAPGIGGAFIPDTTTAEMNEARFDPTKRLNLNNPTGLNLRRSGGLRLLAQGGRAGVDYDSTSPSGGNMDLMYKPFFGETGMDFFVIERGNERMTPGVDPFMPEMDKALILKKQLEDEIGTLSEQLQTQGPFLTDDSRRDLITEIDAKITARDLVEPTFERQREEDIRTRDATRDMPSVIVSPYGASRFAQGGYLETGMGDGMSDEIPASIGGEQDVLLSENEFVIPADVVSGLGNGSSDAGAEKLFAMMDRVRKARTGTKEMGKEIIAERVMPA